VDSRSTSGASTRTSAGYPCTLPPLEPAALRGQSQEVEALLPPPLEPACPTEDCLSEDEASLSPPLESVAHLKCGFPPLEPLGLQPTWRDELESHSTSPFSFRRSSPLPFSDSLLPALTLVDRTVVEPGTEFDCYHEQNQGVLTRFTVTLLWYRDDALLLELVAEPEKMTIRARYHRLQPEGHRFEVLALYAVSQSWIQPPHWKLRLVRR